MSETEQAIERVRGNLASYLQHPHPEDVRVLLAEHDRLKAGLARKLETDEDVKAWLKSDGFKIFCELKHGPVGEVLSMLADGCISRSRAAEAIAEMLVGRTPKLPANRLSEFGEDELPGETVRDLRAELARLTTLRHKREHDGKTIVLCWYAGVCMGKSAQVLSGEKWTPLPTPREKEEDHA